MNIPSATIHVEVVIPSFGRSELLQRAVDSVLAQTHVETTVCVVDDCSPDVPNIHPDPRVRLLRQPFNQGPSAARNAGVASSVADYVAFLDDDDLLVESRIQDCIESARPGLVVVCRLAYLNSSRSAPDRARAFEGDMGRTLLADHIPHIGQALFARQDFIPFDEEMRSCEDWDWWLRMSKLVSFATVEKTGYLMRMHSGARYGRDADVHMANRKRLLAKHDDFFKENRSAYAYGLRRVGQSALVARRPVQALVIFTRSMCIRPSFTTLRMAAVAWLNCFASIRPNVRRRHPAA